MHTSCKRSRDFPTSDKLVFPSPSQLQRIACNDTIKEPQVRSHRALGRIVIGRVRVLRYTRMPHCTHSHSKAHSPGGTGAAYRTCVARPAGPC